MKTVQIGNKRISDNDPCIISLEPGATFSNLDEAKELTSAAASAGADAIKFQTFVPGDCDRMLGKKDLTVDFTTPTGKKQELIYDAIKRRELPEDDWIKLAKYTKDLGMQFITAPYFPETVDLLLKMNVDAIKISKGDVNNVLLVEQSAKTGLPIIIDGREKFSDVIHDVQICEENGNNKIIIMHCPSGYPSEDAGVHLKAIKAMQEKFDYPIGFADHSPGALMNYAAVSMGVKMLEVTITLDKSIEHPEHYMSLEPHELKPFIENVRKIEAAMGDPNILISSRVPESNRRHFVAKNLIQKGEKLSRKHLDFQRPGNLGISVSDGFKILNKIAVNDIPKGTALQWEMFE